MRLYKMTVAFLEPLILKMLQEHPTHGYELRSIIRKKFKVDVGTSTLYPKLASLEKDKLITSTWTETKRMRKVYSLTQKGRDMLKEDTTEFRLIVEPLLTV